MPARLSKLASLTLAFTLALAPLLSAPPAAHAAANNWWLKGASFVPSASDTYASTGFQQSVRNFKAAGGTYVNLVIPYYQSNLWSTDIGPGYNTPTDAALISGISYIRSQGMQVQLSIYLESWTGEWRALINPGDRDTWYRNYGNILTRYATIAQNHGVGLYMLGAELVTMASASQNGDNTQRWVTMINNVRAIYKGKLTYSANRGQQGWASELPNIGFWDKLDYVGVSAYYELYGDGSVSSMKSAWSNVKGYDIDPIYAKTGKPIIFTEVGYRSVDGAHERPWDPWSGGAYNPNVQVNGYTALLEFWGDVSYVQGIVLWHWSPDPNYGGSGNTDYTPQNKPAQDTLKQYWGNSTPPPPPPPTGTPVFSATGSANPANPASGQLTTLGATVTNTGDATSGAVVDLELYNGPTQVSQRFFENQSFATGGSKNYSLTFTPQGTGTYTFKVGVFSGGWAKNYVWNDSAATVMVGGTTSTTTPPTPPGALNIWWPTDGTHISGVQPFKAMLEGMDIASYQMYWQVDGGGLVQMANSTEDYPHKESLVDVSSWTWRSGGPYTVNFVAKDMGGATIKSRVVNILTP